jgi:hypothetical protein
MAFASSEDHFRHASRICVVDKTNRAPGFMSEKRFALRADPAMVHVGGAMGYATFDDSWKGAADEAIPLEMCHNGCHGVRYSQASLVAASAAETVRPSADRY